MITKAYAQTEAGLLQCVRRALKDGASPAEILDAMLMAFPTLGLSKIVWAVDVLLESDLAEFKLAVKPAWHRVGSLRNFPISKTTRVECDNRALFIYRGGATLKVNDSRCPHQRTDIPLEALDGRDLKCPKHGWTFDVRNGKCISGGDRPLALMPSKTERGTLFARW